MFRTGRHLRIAPGVCETPTVPAQKVTGRKGNPTGRSISLKELAKHLKLSPTTLSLVLNGAPAGASIPQETKDRIFAAAKGFNYRPNFLARSLRSQRTFTVGVLVPELSEGYSAQVLGGVESYLLDKGYVYLVASHRHKPKLLGHLPRLLYERCVEGLIGVDTPYDQSLPIPVVCISGHIRTAGVTRIVLNHTMAAEQGLCHLKQLGHRRIAFIRGQDFSSDTKVRWDSIRAVARRLDLTVPSALVAQLGGDSPSPETGYVATRELLKSGKPFTALFAFNDISAIGAVRALREAGRRVPEDVSVVGFDNIPSGAFHIPALTTISQPLHRMGALAAEVLLKRIADPDAPSPEELEVEPELIIRESTCVAPVETKRQRIDT
jgi:DNA-binding LacI/PurR family transcriptional regulator